MSAKINLFAIHAAGARAKDEESRALPQRQYGDPANVVRFEREKCTGCKYERIFIAGGRVPVGVCQKKKPDGAKRLYGTRCEDFRKVGTK